MFNFNKQFAAVIGAARVVRLAERSWAARGLTSGVVGQFRHVGGDQ